MDSRYIPKCSDTGFMLKWFKSTKEKKNLKIYNVQKIAYG
jgi:hypothetical protein